MKADQLLKLLDHFPGTVYQYRLWEDGRSIFPHAPESLGEILFTSSATLTEDGTAAWRYLSSDSAGLLREALERSTKSLETFDAEFQVCPPGNPILWIRTHAVPERQKDGSTLWSGYMEDITAEYAALDRAKQKDALLRELFDNLPDQIYYKDRDGRILGANPACCRHHGKTESEMLGITDFDLYPGEYGKGLFGKEKLLMTDSKIVREREKHIQKDGSTVYLESIKCPLKSKSGRLIGLAGISRDVTWQVENEAALIQSKQESEQSAALIKAIFDNLEDQFYYKDLGSRVLGGNKAWLKARSVASLDELIGKTDKDLHPAPLGDQLFESEQKQMTSGEVIRLRERHEGENGKVLYFESIKCPMRNEQGQIIGLAGISRDVTQQVLNEESLVEAQSVAEAANRAKSEFLAMMSHEIRTPMNGIIGAASLLELSELTQIQREFVQTINVSGENLLTIINDILDYSKIEAGKIELEAIPFLFCKCVENAFDLFVPAASKKNIELLCYVAPGIPKVFVGDTTRLRQVIINLIGNAVKFTEQGEISLKVTPLKVDESRKQIELQFAVKDSGIGIPAEAQERLFQAFTQADASSTRRYGGTGLGLTISRRLVELMGGRIWFESEEGEGSTFFFTVSLPISDQQMERPGQYSVDLLQGKSALIVDDNETNCWLLGDQLKQWGVASQVFRSPKKALEHLRGGHTYDIALIDFQMPDMDGKELAEKIHKLPRAMQMPVVILSSSCEFIAASPAISARLSKPVKVQQLSQQILESLFDSSQEISPVSSSVTEIQIQPRKKHALRILVAEDNAINQRIVKMMLQRLGYENVVVVPDGEDAVAAISDAEYDVILMDIQMAHMSGLEATRLIRKQSGDPEKPWIIALTAGVMEEERAAVIEAGMNGFVSKPLNVKQLEQTLSDLSV